MDDPRTSNDPSSVGPNSGAPAAPESAAAAERLTLLQYYQEGEIDQLREHLKHSIDTRTFSSQELIELAKGSKESAALVKELLQVHRIDETELADRIAREIIGDIEAYVDLHLANYGNKFTLNAPQLSSSVDGSKAKFFNLISLLRDVSILGRKLLETSPRYDSSKPRSLSSQAQTQAHTPPPLPPLQDKLQDKRWQQQQHQRDTKSQVSEEDATSDDLLAALIESSSTDDFLVLSSSLESIELRDMMVAALVLMTSHECFTLSHDIQGVVMVLRRAKFLIRNILAPKNQMELVARLLTAISRYNEMAYVLDLFRERNQFEILLSKGVEKTPGLRIALYNYVKKHPEYYALVTLNFSMFREIAESLEASASKRLEKIVQLGKAKRAKAAARKRVSVAAASSGCGDPGDDAQQPQRTLRKSNSIATSLSANFHGTTVCEGASATAADATEATAAAVAAAATSTLAANNKPLYSRDGLRLCLVELIDASECFARAGCYKRSTDCANRVKLLALQLALLNDVDYCEVNVLDLRHEELAQLIVGFEVFEDAHIVAQAYDYQLAWRQALFRNVILRHRARYLADFCTEHELTEPLIMELVVLYRQYLASSPPLGAGELERLGTSMKLILRHLKRVALKCQLYTEFGFTDAKQELLQNASVRAYLRDLKLA